MWLFEEHDSTRARTSSSILSGQSNVDSTISIHPRVYKRTTINNKTTKQAMTAAPSSSNKTMTDKERLQIIEKEMQTVMLSHFESHFRLHLDAEAALTYANYETNEWFKSQIAMHGSTSSLKDLVNARPFNKTKFLERFAKVDAAMKDDETLLLHMMATRLQKERRMNRPNATTMADREGKKYQDLKQQLAAQLALDENARKATHGRGAVSKKKAVGGGVATGGQAGSKGGEKQQQQRGQHHEGRRQLATRAA
jgi:hypothetical protein